MEQTASSALAGWMTFYEIAGSSAGALTGLQFVVMTLISQTRTTGSMREIQAFGTPTVVHFCVALLISATMAAPWQVFSDLRVCLGVYGVLGVVYSVRVMWHARNAKYNPDAADWTWYTVVPLLAHLVLITAATLLLSRLTLSLVMIAVTDFAFVFLGIRNSWDTVTYISLNRHNQDREREADISRSQ